MTRSDWQTEEFERNRQHLQAVAYRMLAKDRSPKGAFSCLYAVASLW